MGTTALIPPGNEGLVVIEYLNNLGRDTSGGFHNRVIVISSRFKNIP